MTDTRKMSLAIPFKKFFWYSLLTFGVYPTFWAYRVFRHHSEYNLEMYKDKSGIMSPFFKAWFLIFFVADLFTLSYTTQKQNKPKNNINSLNQSSILVIVVLLGNFFIEISDRINPYILEDVGLVGSLIFIIGSAVLTIVYIFAFKKAVENYEQYFTSFETAGEYKERALHWWEYLFIIRGIIVWILTVFGTFGFLIYIFNF